MMPKMMLVIQLAIGAVLLFSSGGKWRNPMGFARGVADYDVLPDRLAVIFGLLLVPLETTVAVSHFTGWWISAAAPLGIAMFGSFAVAVAINLRRGRSLPCYCFGDSTGENISAQSLARLLLLLGGEGLLLLSLRQSGAARLVYHQLVTLREFGFALFWTAFVVVVAMWVLRLPDLHELLRSHVSLSVNEQQAGTLAQSDAQRNAYTGGQQ
ncbi:MAG TPA: MauE/DoxX family redox-associated membrane protein [Anaerolineales bacterium]|nr:MauE/DoxX family redox-associated membrane protein [Anaerolineales bacterium]